MADDEAWVEDLPEPACQHGKASAVHHLTARRVSGRGSIGSVGSVGPEDSAQEDGAWLSGTTTRCPSFGGIREEHQATEDPPPTPVAYNPRDDDISGSERATFDAALQRIRAKELAVDERATILDELLGELEDNGTLALQSDSGDPSAAAPPRAASLGSKLEDKLGSFRRLGSGNARGGGAGLGGRSLVPSPSISWSRRRRSSVAVEDLLRSAVPVGQAAAHTVSSGVAALMSSLRDGGTVDETAVQELQGDLELACMFDPAVAAGLAQHLSDPNNRILSAWLEGTLLGVAESLPQAPSNRRTEDRGARKLWTIAELDWAPAAAKPILASTSVRLAMASVDAAAFEFDAFRLNDATGGHPLAVMGITLLKFHNIFETFPIDPAVAWEILQRIEASYKSNPYHSAIHATDVLYSMHCFLAFGGLRESGISDPLDILSCLLAAIIHDVEHPGVNNDFLIKTEDELAVTHNDKSPLENHHAAAGWRLLTGRDTGPALLPIVAPVSSTPRSPAGGQSWSSSSPLHVPVPVPESPYYGGGRKSIGTPRSWLGQGVLNTLWGRASTDEPAADIGTPALGGFGSSRSSLSSIAVPRPTEASGPGNASPPTIKTEGLLDRLPKEDRVRLRANILALVLATDLKAHFDILGEFQKRLRKSVSTHEDASAPILGGDDNPWLLQVGTPADRMLTMQMALKCADLGHMSRPRDVHMRWVQGLQDELRLQGDRELAELAKVSPMNDRASKLTAKGQCGFFELFILPMVRSFRVTFPLIAPFATAVEANYAYWAQMRDQGK